MKKIFIFLTAILILSSIVAAQELNNVSIAVATKQIGNDNNTGRPIVRVGIYVDRPGHLQYYERYYSLNESNVFIYKKTVKYYDINITDRNLSFKILRPVDPSGQPYYIRARILLNNKTILDDWLKIDKPNNSTKNSTENNSDPPVITKIPGFDALAAFVAIGLISAVFLRRRT